MRRLPASIGPSTQVINRIKIYTRAKVILLFLFFSPLRNFVCISLPYTEAALMEAQRLSNITPLAVAHKALRDTQLRGYSIPRVCLLFHIVTGVQLYKFWDTDFLLEFYVRLTKS